MPEKTALIIGASRGLGRGLAREYLHRGWHVVATVRGTAVTPLHDLLDQANGKLTIETADINKPAQTQALRQRLAGRHFDLLFVNAGISNGYAETIGDVSDETFVNVMVTNALSPMRMIEMFEPLVTAKGSIGAMSSGLGSVADNESGGYELYRASKAALNTLMRSFAARQGRRERSLFLIAPGWVRTDMGGPSAHLDVETSIKGVVDVMTAQSGKSGLHYVDYRGNTVRW